jgi:hypothetical protein
MWMWLLIKIYICHKFVVSLLKTIFWNENFEISNMVSKHGSKYMKWYMVQYTFKFHKIKTILKTFEVYVCFWVHMYTTFVCTNILQSPIL